jgi:hypothetical protein
VRSFFILPGIGDFVGWHVFLTAIHRIKIIFMETRNSEHINEANNTEESRKTDSTTGRTVPALNTDVVDEHLKKQPSGQDSQDNNDQPDNPEYPHR